MKKLGVVLALVSVQAVAAVHARGAVVVWDASSGLTPDQITPAYTLINTAATTPVLSGGALTLSTPAGGDDIQGYRHSGSVLDVPADLRITARLKFDGGSSSFPNRAPAGITFATQAGAINFLWIDRDAIFLNDAGDVRGPGASVDTDGAFHTYRIEVTGKGVGGAVNVFYDDGAAPVLSGALIPSGVTEPEISWGDLSEAVSGTSEWQHFEHNAAAVPEPVGAALLCAGATVLCASRRGRRARHA